MNHLDNITYFSSSLQPVPPIHPASLLTLLIPSLFTLSTTPAPNPPSLPHLFPLPSSSLPPLLPPLIPPLYHTCSLSPPPLYHPCSPPLIPPLYQPWSSSAYPLYHPCSLSPPPLYHPCSPPLIPPLYQPWSSST